MSHVLLMLKRQKQAYQHPKAKRNNPQHKCPFFDPVSWHAEKDESLPDKQQSLLIIPASRPTRCLKWIALLSRLAFFISTLQPKSSTQPVPSLTWQCFVWLYLHSDKCNSPSLRSASILQPAATVTLKEMLYLFLHVHRNPFLKTAGLSATSAATSVPLHIKQ